MFALTNPVKNPFNDWLSSNGVYVAITIAGILLIVVVTILILNKKSK